MNHMRINKLSPLSRKTLNLSTFFCLYIAQAIPMSFFSTAIQVLMRQADYSLSSIALLQLIKLLDIEVSLGTACRPALYHPKRL